MDELTKEFLVESREGLDRMEQCLTELESKPGDAELLAEIFRAVHTIKGTTGFLALPRLEKLAHAGEHLLGCLRDGKLQASKHVVDGLLALLDGLREVLGLIEMTGGEGTRASDEDSELIARLDEIRGGGTGEHTRRAEDVHGGRESDAALQGSGSGGEQSLRVDVETLNRMMNQVGELVLTRNQILQSSGDGERFHQLARRLDSVTADLRETVMRARTQPVGQLFQKFPRMVRDLAQSCGKCVRLDFAGQETRLDKSLLEALKDPITHAIRNAVDHGIELPAVRVKAGKALEGVIRLSAYHEGGQVVIEVSDDGAGIATQRVLARAMERGLISEERSRAMCDEDVQQLIFEAGFSTRDEVTLVSGRGVGMDVVRANVEGVGGVVELESRAGEGTTLRMRVPLTLAIIPALVVRCGGERFALPRTAVTELVVVPRSEEERMVQSMGKTRMLRLREELLPLMSLGDVLRLPREDDKGYFVAVVEGKGRRFGLVLDDLMDPQEIVVKPLARALREGGVFSGASVLGDGGLALIVDVAALAARMNVRVNQEVGPVTTAAALGNEDDASRLMLVFEDHRGERQAVPVTGVERIERVPRTSVETCGGVALLQYRGGLLPVENEGGTLDEIAEDDPITVVICRRNETERVGVVVRKVLDIAAVTTVEQSAGQGAKVAIIHERLATLREDLGGTDWREAA